MLDLSRAGAAIAHQFKPDKMNYQLLGNLVPHIRTLSRATGETPRRDDPLMLPSAERAFCNRTIIDS